MDSPVVCCIRFLTMDLLVTNAGSKVYLGRLLKPYRGKAVVFEVDSRIQHEPSNIRNYNAKKTMMWMKPCRAFAAKQCSLSAISNAVKGFALRSVNFTEEIKWYSKCSPVLSFCVAVCTMFRFKGVGAGTFLGVRT